MGKHERPKKSARHIDWLAVLIGMLADFIVGVLLLVFAEAMK